MENVSRRLDRKFAIDCDGVLFDFNRRFIEYCNEMFNVEIPNVSAQYPDEWHYVLKYLTKQQNRAAWASICDSEDNYDFWRHLPIYEWSRPFALDVGNIPHVFITSRCGRDCHRATSHALQAIGFINPLVVVANKKAQHILDHGCTDLIDDKQENFEELRQADPDGKVRQWILDQPWNRTFNPSWIRRIYDPREILL